MSLQKRVVASIAAVLVAGAAVFGMWLATVGTRSGVGTYGDSVTYYVAARSLAAGHGLKQAAADGTMMPLLQFPPGYPALLAAVSAVLAHGGDVLAAARWINIAAAGLSIALVGWLVYRLGRAPAFAVAAAALLAVHGQAVGIWLRMYSEPTYITLVLGVVAVLSRGAPRGRRLVLAGLLAAAAVLTRFAGVQLAGACGLWIVAINWPLGWRVRLRRLAAFGVPVVLAAGGWSVRNWLVSGHGTSRVFGNHPPTIAQISPLWDAIKFWVIPIEGPWQYPAMILIFVLWAVVPAWRLYRRGVPRRGYAARLALPAVIVLTYLPFVLIARAYFDPAIPFNYRLMSPVHALSLVVVFSWLGRWWRIAMRRAAWGKERGKANGRVRQLRVAAKGAAIIAAVVAAGAGAGLVVVQSREALLLVHQTGGDGMGYGERQWATSPGLDAVRALPADAVIYSNATDALLLLTSRPSRMLPLSSGYDRKRTKDDVRNGLVRLHRAMVNQHAYVVYFPAIKRGRLYINERQLQAVAPEAAVQTLADAHIYTIQRHVHRPKRVKKTAATTQSTSAAPSSAPAQG